MRRLAAISLLLLLFALTSGASTIACAANCAQRPAATPAPAMMHMHHHHAMAATLGTCVGAEHCSGRVPRALAQHVLVSGPQHSLALESRSAQAVDVAGTFELASAPLAASPPGPPLLPTQLRI